jgi:hypothetical protein
LNTGTIPFYKLIDIFYKLNTPNIEKICVISIPNDALIKEENGFISDKLWIEFYTYPKKLCADNILYCEGIDLHKSLIRYYYYQMIPYYLYNCLPLVAVSRFMRTGKHGGSPPTLTDIKKNKSSHF